METLILFAARDSWLSWAIGAVILFIYVMNHLLTLSKAKNPPTRKPPVPRPADRAQGRPPRPPRTDAPRPELTPEQAKINAEIEEFMRRAKDRRGQTPREPAAGSGSGSRQTAQQNSGERGAQPRQIGNATDVPVLEQRDFDAVAESVEKHLSNRSFGERAKHLADDIVRADEQMEQHMQAAFTRRVGTLQDSGDQGAKADSRPVTDAEPSAVTDQSAAAAALAAMLRNPQSIRQAFVMQEILQRPEHRW